MSTKLTRLDWTIITLIVVLALFQLILISGVVQGEDALAAPPSVDTSRLPQGNAPPANLPGSEAETDDSAALPGQFVRSQGRSHVQGQWPLDRRVPYCREDQISNFCYASLPPTSGLHLGVQARAVLDGGNEVRLPPPPGIYDFEIPREAVPHIQEHAGVFIGYHCQRDECDIAVSELQGLVEEQLALGAQLIMSPFLDLDANTIALASWTRIDSFSSDEYDDERARRFIEAHSCRFDPEGFCSN